MGNYTIRPEAITRTYASNGLLYEGISLQPASRMLTWVDILGGKLFFQDVHDLKSAPRTVDLPLPSATTFSQSSLIVASKHHIHWLDIEQLTKVRSLKVPTMNPALVTNEMQMDPFGNVWVGMMDRGGKSTGELWIFTTDEEFILVSREIGIPNTLLWDLQRDRFYFGDSAAGAIYVQPISTSSIRASASVFYTTGRLQFAGVPDGSELVVESGSVLNCRWDGGAVIEISETGNVVNSWELPWDRPTDIVRSSASNFIISSAANDSPNSRKPGLGAVFELTLI